MERTAEGDVSRAPEQPGDQRAEIGQRDIVRDRRQAQRAEEKGGRLEPRDDRLQPPLLHSAQNDKPAYEIQCNFKPRNDDVFFPPSKRY